MWNRNVAVGIFVIAGTTLFALAIFLIGSQNLQHLGLHPGVFDLNIDHGLCVLRGERACLGLVECTILDESVHGGVVLMHLLHERLHRGFFVLPDGLDLILLSGTQVEGVGVKAKHMAKLTVWTAVAVHAALSE